VIRRQASQSAPISARLNMTPLVDMVFILLIFFVVTSSFVKESGVDVSRPEAETASTRERANIVIAVTEAGEVWIDGREVGHREVRAHVERLHAENPEGSVIIVADEGARTGLTVAVLDQARLAGVTNVSIAATSVNDGGGPR
jgi:biopolymer transport protein ExbD